MIKVLLRKAFLCCCFMTAINSYGQNFVLHPMVKDSLGVNSISYKISGNMEFQFNDSLVFQLDLVAVHTDSLEVIYHMESGFDQAAHPTNSLLNYDPVSGEFEVQCGLFTRPDLMVHLLVSKEGEKIEEMYFK